MNNQWFSKVAVWLVIAMVLFTVFKQFDTRGVAGAGAIGYSDFLEFRIGTRSESIYISENGLLIGEQATGEMSSERDPEARSVPALDPVLRNPRSNW